MPRRNFKKMSNKLIIKTGADLKRLRKEQGYTMQSLADKLKVSREQVTKWESGKENMTLGTVARFCDAIGVEARVIFKVSKTESYSFRTPFPEENKPFD